MVYFKLTIAVFLLIMAVNAPAFETNPKALSAGSSSSR